jgi:hypothetical protein
MLNRCHLLIVAKTTIHRCGSFVFRPPPRAWILAAVAAVGAGILQFPAMPVEDAAGTTHETAFEWEAKAHAGERRKRSTQS